MIRKEQHSVPVLEAGVGARHDESLGPIGVRPGEVELGEHHRLAGDRTGAEHREGRSHPGQIGLQHRQVGVPHERLRLDARMIPVLIARHEIAPLRVDLNVLQHEDLIRTSQRHVDTDRIFEMFPHFAVVLVLELSEKGERVADARLLPVALVRVLHEPLGEPDQLGRRHRDARLLPVFVFPERRFSVGRLPCIAQLVSMFVLLS